MIRHYRHITQRPDVFRLNPDAELAQGLVFAGLAPGGLVGSTHYHDSSLYGNHGTLVGMDPATDWVFDPTLGRYAVNASTTTKMVVGNTPRFGSYGTVSCWFRSTGTPASFGKFFLIGTGEVQLFRNDANTNIVLAINGTNPIFIVPNLWNGIQHSIIAQWAPNWRRVIIDGVPITASTTAYTFPSLSASWYLGNQAAGNRVIGGLLGDVIGYDRIISDAEIQQLSDPSNTLLSGLILPPRRMVFPAAVAAGGIPEGYASLSSVADIAAVGYAEHSGSAPLGAVASLTATGYHQSIAYATVSAIADLTAVGYTSHAGTANLSAIVGLSATGYATHSGEADLSAIADMVAVGESPSIIPEGSATLSAIADMTAVGYASHAGEAALDAVADIAAVGYRESAGYAVLAAVAGMVAVGSVPGEEGGAGAGGKTADGLTWPDVDGLTWGEVDGLEWWIAPSSLHCHIRVTPALHACCISRPELSACIHATPAIHGEAVVQ